MPGKRGPTLRRVLANNVRRKRLGLGLSQEAFAERAGLHRTYISSVERTGRNITLDNVERIAAALGVSAASLLEDGRR